jgi:hypothetical protein
LNKQLKINTQKEILHFTSNNKLMKKIYFLIALSFLFNIGYSQIVAIPDVQFKNRLLQASQYVNVATNISGSYIKIDTNLNGEIEVNEAAAVGGLELSNCGITNLTGIEAFTELRVLRALSNQLTSVNFTSNIYLNNLNLNSNQITSNAINLTGLYLFGLYISDNALSTFDFYGAISIRDVYIGGNDITSMNLSGHNEVNTFSCYGNLITSLDVSEFPALGSFNCYNCPQLTFLNLKNSAPNSSLVFGSCPNLRFICADEGMINSIQNQITQYSYTNCNLNSYCSFSPGGNFFSIQGNSKYDADANGCGTNDLNSAFKSFSITDGTNTSIVISNNLGDYSLPVIEGTYTITPLVENSSYFNISPTSSSVIFPDATSPFLQNFCTTANGSHTDIEVSIFPITPARPGFNASYKIIYKNKGTTPQSGYVEMAFDDNKSNFVASVPDFSNQASSLITWNYVNLLPSESRSIVFVVQINSPIQTPPINSGDYLGYRATVFPIVNDELPYDNNQDLKQLVVNSLDPNDKICAEGPAVEPAAIGKYVHYIIRFENTGTFPAENVVVKDLIDLSKFDVSSLTPVTASHPFVTRISANNKVEFIFENINLPFENNSNDGYVAYKIKTLPSLVLGDTFTNKANIYFDYNFPIITNTASTTIQSLATNDFDFKDYFSLYPNPTNGIINIKSKKGSAISSISIYNTLGQLVLIATGNNNSIDVSSLKTGTYFIKVTSDKGTAGSKFMKN